VAETERRGIILNLTPISFGYKISTTDLQMIYTESGGVKIEVDAIRIPLENIEHTDEKRYKNIEFVFPLVAEAKCVTLNFYENHESNIEGNFTGFYLVENSQNLQQSVDLYDPHKRLNLQHYIIAGYDAYVEIIASAQYTISEKVEKST
jgi:hypothetical protein